MTLSTHSYRCSAALKGTAAADRAPHYKLTGGELGLQGHMTALRKQAPKRSGHTIQGKVQREEGFNSLTQTHNKGDTYCVMAP